MVPFNHLRPIGTGRACRSRPPLITQSYKTSGAGSRSKSKLPVESGPENGHGAAVAVVGGVGDELIIQRAVEALPDLKVIVGVQEETIADRPTGPVCRHGLPGLPAAG